VSDVRGGWRQELGVVVLVLLIGGLVKGWLFAGTQVLARDSVGYILYAYRLGCEPWPAVLRSEQQHPLYPVAIFGVQRVLRMFGEGESRSLHWQTAAQTANLLSGLILAVPMYLLGQELFNRRVGFWAAVSFQVMPVPARITADALSEGTYLLWASVALLLAVKAWRLRRPAGLLLSGMAAGLAYLTRPEGGFLPAAIAGVMVVAQAIPAWRQPWSRWAWGLTLMALGFVSLAAPYWITIGGLTNKPASLDLFRWLHQQLAAGEGSASGVPGCLLASRFTDGVDGVPRPAVGPFYALAEVLDEVCKGFNYSAWLPLVLGLGWYFRQARRSPGLLLVLLLILVQLLVLWLVAYRARYVSERHTLLVVLCGCVLALATLFHWAAIAAIWGRRSPWGSAGWRRLLGRRNLRGLVHLAMIFLVAAALVQTLKPLHEHRLGHKMAGLWLAQNLRPGDRLVDPYGLAGYYAEQRWPGTDDRSPVSKGYRYLVVELADLDRHRRELVEEELSRLAQATVVFAWPDFQQAELVVYRGSGGKPSP
jgi:hypothetical protein